MGDKIGVFVCGASKVGKSALIRAFRGRSLDTESPTRKCSDESNGCYEVPFQNYTLRICEQRETGLNTLATEVEHFAIFLICYAVNDKASHEYALDLRKKIERIKEVYEAKYSIVLVGTKDDESDQNVDSARHCAPVISTKYSE